MDLEVILCIIAGGALVYGLYKGFIAQLASIGGLIFGIIACRLFHQQIGDFMMKLSPTTFSSYGIATTAGCIVIFLCVYFLFYAFAGLLRRLTHTLRIGWIDRLLGGIVSVFKWLLLCSIFLNIWHFINPESSIFSEHHLMGEKPFGAIMKLAPRIFGIVNEQISMLNC